MAKRYEYEKSAVRRTEQRRRSVSVWLLRRTCRRAVLLPGLGVSLVLSSPVARAGTSVWTGGGANNGWGNSANWSGGIPTTGSDVIFAGTASLTSLISLIDGDYRLNSLTFNNGTSAKAFTITEVGADNQPRDNILFIGAGGITNNTSLTQTINAVVHLSANTTFNATAAGGTLSLLGTASNVYNNLQLNSYTLTVAGAGNVSIASPITSTGGGITKNGTGTLTLTGVNTYTGTTTVNGGTLNVGTSGSSSTLGTGNVTVSGGMLNFNAASAGSVAITNIGNSYLYFNNSSSAGSARIFNSAQVAFNNEASAGTATITNNGTIYFSGSSSANIATIVNNSGAFVDLSSYTGSGGLGIGRLSGAGAVYLGNKTLTLGTLNTSDTISGVISDGGLFGGTGGSLVKTGTGTLTLTGANTYTGTTTVNGGTLNVGTESTSSSLGNRTGSVTINSGILSFYNTSSAGSASITNSSGNLDFYNASSAGTATIANNPGRFLSFYSTSSAGGATINSSGNMYFRGNSSAGNATITNLDYAVDGRRTGTFYFGDTSSAGSATINNSARMGFLDNSTAGTATITNAYILGFGYTSSAGNATINNFNTIDFYGDSSGGTARITNYAILDFELTASAGSASITNNNQLNFNGGSNAGSAAITSSNQLNFNSTSSAGSASITNSKVLNFNGGSNAGIATIINNGGTPDNYTAGDDGLTFKGTSSAGSASITNNKLLRFRDQSSANTATIVNNSGALLDLSSYTGSGSVGMLTIGSLSGAGTTYLGNTALTLGGLNRSDTISGAILDTGATSIPGRPAGGGTLTKIGTGTLTLTGANTYTGGTIISQGTVVASGGSLGGTTLTSGGLGTGAVTVSAGATLSVGQAVNTGDTSLSGYGSLALSSLTLVGGSSTPLLTFNLGPMGSADGSTNDLLRFSSSANSLVLSGSGVYWIGFASQSGSPITGSPSYTLMTFGTPVATGNATLANPNSIFTGIGVGNLNTPSNGSFSWVTNNGNITGLQYSFTSAQVIPEPSALGLLGFIAFPAGGYILRRRKADKKEK